MSIVDNGTQTVKWKYLEDATAEALNKKFAGIVKDGIYEGGLLSISSGDLVAIASFNALFKTSTLQTVQVSTANDATLTINETQPYITATFGWGNFTENYLDFNARAIGELLDNDVIFGEGTYLSGTLISFNYSKKTWGLTDEDGNVFGVSLTATGDSGALEAGVLTLTNGSNSTLSTGTGTIKLTGTGTTGTNTGFLKAYLGTDIIYIPYFKDIVGS